MGIELFHLAEPQDILRIWLAKGSSFDAAVSLDVQLLCGGGLDETRRFLEASPLPEAKDAWNYLISCQTTGDFDGFSPEDQIRAEERYYGVLPSNVRDTDKRDV